MTSQTRPRFATSRDENQAAIMADLRALGFYVRDVSAFIAEWDIEVYTYHWGFGRGIWGHFEIKTPTGKMQESQTAFAQLWGDDAVPIVETAEDVVDWYGRR